MAAIEQIVTPYVRFNQLMNAPLRAEGYPFQHFGHQWKHYHRPAKTFLYRKVQADYFDNILRTACQMVSDLPMSYHYLVTDGYSASPEGILPAKKHGREHFYLRQDPHLALSFDVPTVVIHSVIVGVTHDSRVMLLDVFGRRWWIMLCHKAVTHSDGAYRTFQALSPLMTDDFTWTIPMPPLPLPLQTEDETKDDDGVSVDTQETVVMTSVQVHDDIWV